MTVAGTNPYIEAHYVWKKLEEYEIGIYFLCKVSYNK